MPHYLICALFVLSGAFAYLLFLIWVELVILTPEVVVLRTGIIQITTSSFTESKQEGDYWMKSLWFFFFH